MSQRAVYESKLIETDTDILKYQFGQIEGDTDFDLMRVVFKEFIELPILRKMERGEAVISMAQSPLLNNIVRVNVAEKTNEHLILYSISGSLLANKIVPIEESNAEDKYVYIKLNDGTAIRLINASDRNLSMVIFLHIITDLLDGMKPSVDPSDYIPCCRTCVFQAENMKYYLGLLEEDYRDEIKTRVGCVLGRENYDVDRNEAECEYYIRNTYPDTADIFAVIMDLFGA